MRNKGKFWNHIMFLFNIYSPFLNYKTKINQIH